MNKVTFENASTAAIAAGFVGLMLGLSLGTTKATTQRKPKFDLAKATYQTCCTGGKIMHHVYYETDEYEYETSGDSLGEAIDAMRELVNM